MKCIKIYIFLLLGCLFMPLSADIMIGQTVSTTASNLVRGAILDADRLPLVGAYVQNLTNGVGAVADNNGRYSIKAVKGDKLKVSFLGMKSKVVTIGNSANQDIILAADEHVLENVVVTGYRKVNNRVFVGSATKVKTAELSQTATPDISRMLQGRVSGLNISNVSSTFGSAPKINIRGGGSINGNVSPLWVIDGVIFDELVNLNPERLASGDAVTLVGSAISGINPEDIESVEVLKDASATSLYGARGMNGVIVVTTKMGQKGEGFHLGYSFDMGVRQKPNIRNYNILNSGETMSLLLEMKDKGYFSIDDALNGRRSGVFNQLYNGIMTPVNGGGYTIPNTDEGRNKFFRNVALRNTDWFSHLFTNNLTQNHTLSMRYSSDKVATYSSIGLFSDAGYAISDKVDRLTAHLKTTYFVNNNLDLSLSLMGNYRKQRTNGTTPRIKYPEIGSFRRDFEINPFAYALSTSPTLRPYGDDGGLEYYQNDWTRFNIIEELANNYIDVAVGDWRLQADALWRITDDLKLSALVSARTMTSTFEHYISENSNMANAYRANGSMRKMRENIYLYHPDASDLMVAEVALPYGGMYNKENRQLLSLLSRLTVDYNHRYGAHRINLFGFTELRRTDNIGDNFDGYGISFRRGNTVNTFPNIFLKNSLQGDTYFRKDGVYDRGVTLSVSATYSYDNRYVANAVVNYEGSNLAGSQARVRWLPTWNVGGKWNIDRETFVNWSNLGINQFAVRASYGLVAKMIPQATNSMIEYNSIVNFRRNLADRDYGVTIKSNENRDLTWEKMYELNLGLDMGFINNRITLNADYYDRNSFDLIDLVRTSGVGGDYYKWANFGDMNTKGVDLSVTTRNIDSKDWRWTTTAIFSYYKQAITSLKNVPNAFDLVSGQGRGNVLGHPRSSLYSYQFAGLSDKGLPTFYYGDLPTGGQPYAQSTAANFNDTQYPLSYLKYEGSTEPNMSIGLDNRISYKGFELSVFITYQGGNVVRISPMYDVSYQDVGVFSRDYANRWLVKGDEKLTNVPVIPSKDLINIVGQENIERAYNTYNYSDIRVADGSFVRVKNVTLSYSVPTKKIEKLGLNRLVFSLEALNPVLLYSDSKLRGQDPEFVNAGGVSSPITRMYTFSTRINF